MGLHLTSGALNQAALARNQARAAADCWIVAAVLFVAWMLVPLIGEELLRTEIGYARRDALLAADAGCVLPARHARHRRSRTPRREPWSAPVAPTQVLSRASRRSASRLLSGPRRPPRSRSRRPGVGRSEHRRAGHEQVGPAVASGRRWRDRCRRPPRRRPRRRGCARRRSIFSSEWAMNGCPPQPGLTVMHRARSIAESSSAERARPGSPG